MIQKSDLRHILQGVLRSLCRPQDFTALDGCDRGQKVQLGDVGCALGDEGLGTRMSWSPSMKLRTIWGLPKIRGTILGVPIIRIIVFWGLYWGPPKFGKLPFKNTLEMSGFPRSEALSWSANLQP